MRILDLFSGAGGAAMGLHLAFPHAEITGVDIEPMPRYPFNFVQADAMTYPLDGYDLVWASPPCQAYSFTTKHHRAIGKTYPNLLPPTRDRLQAWGGPYIIENVPLAPMHNPVVLCGEMFGLGVVRHRQFETNWYLPQPQHVKHRGTVADGSYCRVAGHGGGVKHGRSSIAAWSEAMGIDWMTKKELAEAIPPAYSQYIGEQFAQCCWAEAA